MENKLLVPGVWERGTFTVPDSVPDEKVQAVAHKYKSKFGETLEKQGFVVFEMTGVFETQGRMPAELGRKRYDCFARVGRVPVEIHLDVPDLLVPEMQKVGLKLNE